MKKYGIAAIIAASMLLTACGGKENTSGTNAPQAGGLFGNNNITPTQGEQNDFDIESNDSTEQINSSTEESLTSPQNPDTEYWEGVDYSDESYFILIYDRSVDKIRGETAPIARKRDAGVLYVRQQDVGAVCPKGGKDAANKGKQAPRSVDAARGAGFPRRCLHADYKLVLHMYICPTVCIV